MDVDEDEEGSQHIKRMPDYGIEVDFSSLDEDDLEVSARFSYSYACILTSYPRMALRNDSRSWTSRLRSCPPTLKRWRPTSRRWSGAYSHHVVQSCNL